MNTLAGTGKRLVVKSSERVRLGWDVFIETGRKVAHVEDTMTQEHICKVIDIARKSRAYNDRSTYCEYEVGLLASRDSELHALLLDLAISLSGCQAVTLTVMERAFN